MLQITDAHLVTDTHLAGARANFVAVPAKTLAEAIAERPPGRQTWLNGIKQ